MLDIRTATVHDGDESFVNLILVFGVSMGQGLEQSHSRLSVLHAGGLGQTLCDHLDTFETDRQTVKDLFLVYVSTGRTSKTYLDFHR